MSTEEKLDLRQTAYVLANNIHGDTSKAEEIYQFLARAFDEKTECDASPPNEAKEIDWDRPQLVKCSVHNNELIVRTIGKHHGLLFAGVAITNPNKSVREYFKEDFVYYGEIPNDHLTEKTTGLNFLEAMELADSGNAIKRELWIEPSNVIVKNSSNELVFRNSSTNMIWDISDFLATDWQIVKP